MELKDLKEKLRKKTEFYAVSFDEVEMTFLKGVFYEITGKAPRLNCSVCISNFYKTLYLKACKDTELTLEEQYINKYNKPLPNRYKYNEDWIKSKL